MAKTFTITEFVRNGTEAYIEFSQSGGTRPNISKSGELAQLQEWLNSLDLENEDFIRILLLWMQRAGIAFTNANRANIVGKSIVVDPDSVNVVRIV